MLHYVENNGGRVTGSKAVYMPWESVLVAKGTNSSSFISILKDE